MLGAYYSKAVDSHNIFDKLKISKDKSYKEHLNKYNVLSISFNQVSHKGNTYDDYIGMIKANLIKDISDKYPQIDPSEYFTINHMLNLFLFLMSGIIFLLTIFLKIIKMTF